MKHNYVGIEYRYVVMCWALYDHAARATANRDKSDMYAQIANKYRKRADVLGDNNPWLARAVHDAAASVSHKRPEYKDVSRLSLIYVPFNSNTDKFCKCCGELHNKTDMAKTCQHIGDSSSTNHAYYNCQCGSTLVVPTAIKKRAT